MNTRRTLARFLPAAAGVLLVVGVAASTPATAEPVKDRPGCSTGTGNQKKCPSPTPTPTAEVNPQPGDDTFTCLDITSGGGLFRGVSGVGAIGDAIGTVLEFDTGLAAASCTDATYTVIARDMHTLVEVGRHAQAGNGLTNVLRSVLSLPEYTKNCVAVDVVVESAGVVQDFAPDLRSPLSEYPDLCRTGPGSGQTWR